MAKQFSSENSLKDPTKYMGIVNIDERVGKNGVYLNLLLGPLEVPSLGTLPGSAKILYVVEAFSGAQERLSHKKRLASHFNFARVSACADVLHQIWDFWEGSLFACKMDMVGHFAVVIGIVLAKVISRCAKSECNQKNGNNF